ncbi:MAG: plastocyanin/azurin family copper-binding protein [Gemmatimonadales bacterium]
MMRGYSAGRALAMGSLLVLVAWGCGGNDSSPNPGPPVLAKAPSQSGDQQTGPAGETLPNDLRVLVTTDGIPQAGATITWSTTDGSVSPTSVVTTASGIGATTWTLGPNAGTQTATAAVTGATGSPQTFTATASDGGGPLPDPTEIAVTVADNSFTSERNGTTDPAVDTLAINGTVTWTWGPAAGSHSVRSTGSPSFVSSLVKTGAGQSYSLIFTEAGTYAYDCSIHGSAMTGRIVVR